MERKPIPSTRQSGRKSITLTWNIENSSEVNAAKEKFTEYVQTGWLAFAETPEKRRIQIFEFEPRLKAIILIPFSEGG